MLWQISSTSIILWRHMSAMAYQITDDSIFCSRMCSGEQQKASKLCITTILLWGEFTGGRWISLTTGPLKMKEFPCHDVMMFQCQLSTIVTLTHWGRVTHICVSDLTIIGSDNGLSPGRQQAIIWTNAGILLIGPLGTNLSETTIDIHTFSLQKMHPEISSGKWRPFSSSSLC